MITKGTYQASSDSFNQGKFMWDGGSTAKLWTDQGDLILKGVQKLDDGSLVATSGYGKFGGWYGNLKDNDGDGYVLKIGTQNPNGTFDFEVDLKKGMDVKGHLH